MLICQAKFLQNMAVSNCSCQNCENNGQASNPYPENLKCFHWKYSFPQNRYTLQDSYEVLIEAEREGEELIYFKGLVKL